MQKDALTRFKRLFDERKRNAHFNENIISEDFAINTDDRADDMDQASSDSDQSLRLRLRNREIMLLKKVDEALYRIQIGTFGLCHSCGGDIEVKRLEARPTATLCIVCKEEEEKRDTVRMDGRASKSLGRSIRLS